MEQPRKKGKFIKIKDHHRNKVSTEHDHNYAITNGQPALEIGITTDRQLNSSAKGKTEQVIT